jgi:hypothetical protein
MHDGAQRGARNTCEGSSSVGRNSEFCGYSNLTWVATQELAKAAFSFAVTIHGSDVKMTDTSIPGGLEHSKRITPSQGSHDTRTAEAEPTR